MAIEGKCEYPGCNHKTSDYHPVFKKWFCVDHDFHTVTWPIKKKEPKESEDKVNTKLVDKMAKRKGFGKNFFKKK